jgi:hypothetical protein
MQAVPSYLPTPSHRLHSQATLADGRVERMDVQSILEDVILIGVVIAAGCERCTERAVGRALSQGVPDVLIRRTLRVVAGIRSQKCFGQAVGPEVVAHMEKPLEAGWQALQRTERSTASCGCGESSTAVR